MLLQSTLPHQKLSLPSTHPPFLSKDPNFTLPQTPLNYRKHSISCAASSQSHIYDKTVEGWSLVYRRIFMMDNPELGAGTVLNQWLRERKTLHKEELHKVVKELRRVRKYKQAIEVYDWIGERYRLSAGDAAIQLGLIARVCGVSTAEIYFYGLPESSKDRKIYGAMLNAYVRAGMRKEANSLFDKIRQKGYANEAFLFNLMMTLYMRLKEYEKVILLISEMISKNIQLNTLSYNIWLSYCGAQGSIEKMEEALKHMKKDKSVCPDWVTFSTVASMYIKSGQLEKAECCLKKLESKIEGRNHKPYRFLMTLYGTVGNKEGLLRVWRTYKSALPNIPNMGYHSVMSSLVRMDEIIEAEKIYVEWLSAKSSFDSRLVNPLMSWHVKAGNFKKAVSWFDYMNEVGGKPDNNTWEILAEGHIRKRRINEALSCYGKAFSSEIIKRWKPNPAYLASFFKLCEEEDDMASKEALEGLLMQSGCVIKDEEDENHDRFEMLLGKWLLKGSFSL